MDKTAIEDELYKEVQRLNDELYSFGTLQFFGIVESLFRAVDWDWCFGTLQFFGIVESATVFSKSSICFGTL